MVQVQATEGHLAWKQTKSLAQVQQDMERAEQMFPDVKHPGKRAFLIAFPAHGSIFRTAKALGMPYTTAYNWTIQGDDVFNRYFGHAQKQFADYLEHTAMARIEDPQGNRGSDTLLIAMLNANNPEKWRPNVVVKDDSRTLILIDQLKSLAQVSPGSSVAPAASSDMPQLPEPKD